MDRSTNKKNRALKTIAILASGDGTNAENIIRAVQRGLVKAKVAFVFSDRRGARVLERARKRGVPYVSFEPREFKNYGAYECTLEALIRSEKTNLIVLAGYMRILSARFVKRFPNRIINIHPSLLPAFRGVGAIRQAYDYGVPYSGVTVHFVTPEVDAGPAIMARPVALKPGETLGAFEKRVHQIEYRIYPEALRLVLEGRLRIQGRRVIIQKRRT